MAANIDTSSLPSAELIAPIQVDPDQDIDPGYDSGSLLSQGSSSLSSSVFNYKYENGRRYHAYREGEYIMPNDEKEQDRLDYFHHIFRMMLGGNLYRAPLPPNPQRILDYGTGTGIWAIDIADEFPSAEVPTNCKFYVDDVESDWSYNEKFDFIHGRGMVGAIGDWAKLCRQMYENVKPGGWVEMQEYEVWIGSEDLPIEKVSLVSEWQTRIDEASIKFGKQFNAAGQLKQKLVDAGFVNVEDYVFKGPIGPWPKDPKLKELGRYYVAQVVDAVEPATLALYTRVLGCSLEETQAVVAGVKADMKNPKNHLYVLFHFVYGQRPEDAED